MVRAVGWRWSNRAVGLKIGRGQSLSCRLERIDFLNSGEWGIGGMRLRVNGGLWREMVSDTRDRKRLALNLH